MLILSSILLLAGQANPSPFDFKDGDRVVFVGGTLIEREQKYGDWELALTLRNKDRKVTFRNLGWSGDNVWGESRNSFDANPKGYERLIKLATDLKPTVVFLCYGQNESYGGETGLPAFKTQYQKLITDCLTKTRARIVLMTPMPFEDVKPSTNAEQKNEYLKRYNKAVAELAKENKVEFFDLFAAVDTLPVAVKLTDNGVHMASEGYAISSTLFNPALELKYLNEFGLSPIKEKDRKQNPAFKVVLPTTKESQELRMKIVAKNELFFHRWRPQNETYLFGFRKREQGNNAVEIPQFDPLIDAAEKEIDDLRKKWK